MESVSLAGNVAKHRALERSGYRPIARLRHAVLRDGAWLDAYLFEILRDEWEAGGLPLASIPI